MKYITFVIILIGLVACSKEEEEIFTPIFEAGDMEYGWVSAKKNNLDFLASGLAIKLEDYPDYFGIQFFTETEQGFQRENFCFAEINLKEGAYDISGNYGLSGQTPDDIIGAAYFTMGDDGDVLGDKYILDESKNNSLTIIEVDTANNFVKGTFDVWFIFAPDWEKTNPNNPDKVSLRNAEFELSFYEE